MYDIEHSDEAKLADAQVHLANRERELRLAQRRLSEVPKTEEEKTAFLKHIHYEAIHRLKSAERAYESMHAKVERLVTGE